MAMSATDAQNMIPSVTMTGHTPNTTHASASITQAIHAAIIMTSTS